MLRSVPGLRACDLQALEHARQLLTFGISMVFLGVINGKENGNYYSGFYRHYRVHGWFSLHAFPPNLTCCLHRSRKGVVHPCLPSDAEYCLQA